jgi:hypothetical protein
MSSPFPGMDPYLEQPDAWHDFQKRLVPMVATVLGSELRPRYLVKIDEHIFVHELATRSRRWVGTADISVGRDARLRARILALGAETELKEAPVIVRLPPLWIANG